MATEDDEIDPHKGMTRAEIDAAMADIDARLAASEKEQKERANREAVQRLRAELKRAKVDKQLADEVAPALAARIQLDDHDRPWMLDDNGERVSITDGVEAYTQSDGYQWDARRVAELRSSREFVDLLSGGGGGGWKGELGPLGTAQREAEAREFVAAFNRPPPRPARDAAGAESYAEQHRRKQEGTMTDQGFIEALTGEKPKSKE